MVSYGSVEELGGRPIWPVKIQIGPRKVPIYI
jgi:hypothetical protein